jgi:hypothetical protein
MKYCHKMYIIPRTPASPSKKSYNNQPQMTTYYYPIPNSPPGLSTIPNQYPMAPPNYINTNSYSQKDVYDLFLDIYFYADIKIRQVLLKRINDYVGHPVYKHLLDTMDKNNAHYVMGYLRSQKLGELYNILKYIVNNPLPTKYDFYNLKHD